MSPKLRVGLVGAGIGRRHMTGYDWNKELFDVAVICSLDADRGEKLCADFGVPEYNQDFDALIKRDDLDVIDIATPPHLHFEMAKKAIEAGKDVICEKPLFGSIAEVDEMAELLEKTGRRLMPIFQYRYGTGLQKLKRLVDSGLAGKAYMTTIETHWWRPAAYYDVKWRGKWATELGGGILGHAVHAHDMLNYIHGPTAEVFGFNATLVNDIEVEDNSALAVRMANGSLATLSMSLGSRDEISRLRFCFENLVAESIREPYTMGRDPWTFKTNDPDLQARIDAEIAKVSPTEDGYTRQFQLFHEAVAGGSELPVTLDDARRALELVTAAYYSGRTGKPGILPIKPDHPYYRSWAP
jgi:predicted dehydrogenase